jgi:hypothetical protein
MFDPESLQVVSMSISELTPAEYNPRLITDEAKARLKKSIQKYGCVQPIVWNKRTGNIIGGHQRFDVLVSLGAKKVPTVVLDLDEGNERLLNLTMNSPEAQGTWESHKLGLLGAELSQFDGISLPDVEDLGIPELFEDFKIPFDMNPLDLEWGEGGGLEGEEDMGLSEEVDIPIEYRIIIECDDEEEQARLLEFLDREGIKCHASMS